MLKKVFISALGLTLLTSQAQNYPKNDFRSPIDTVMRLVGNFGELRNIHFHAGLDIRTANHEGMPIHAIGDGYVSRIRTGTFGYGKVLYITHPNGYTSVYAHLQSFNDSIGAFMKRQQIEKESYELEVLVRPNELKVKKGQIIALSGNTGGSTGPHLHFEIRDTKTEAAINPQLFGLAVEDKARPIVAGIFAFPLDENSSVNGDNKNKPHPIVGKKGGIAVVQGRIGFGIEAYDKESYSTGKNGVYSVELRLDGKKIYSHRMDAIPFEDSRYINCHVDYATSRTSGRNVQRSFLVKNNKLGIYHDLVNRGIVEFKNDSVHTLMYILKDIAGNTTYSTFKVKSVKEKPSAGIVTKKGSIFKCDAPFTFEKGNLKVIIPANCLYDDCVFEYSTAPKLPVGKSEIHKICSKLIPAHGFYTLAIKPTNLPERLGPKAVIVNMDDNHGRSIDSSRWENGWVVTKTRMFGDFFVKVDTIPPNLTPINIRPGKNMSKTKGIQFKVSDNLTGIKSVKAYIDGKFIVMEHEHKKNSLFYMFDRKLTPGKHSFLIEVRDGRDNVCKYACNFLM